MQGIAEYKIGLDTTAICAMRYSGATLEQIAARIGKTKERVRQILIRHYGSTKHRLLSTRQLCKLSGLSWKRIMQLYRAEVIAPVKEWDTSNGHYALWSFATVKQIRTYLEESSARGRCRICHGPVPAGRKCYCSERCYKESHKYKYRSSEARQRHLATMRKYKEARRLSLASSVNHG